MCMCGLCAFVYGPYSGLIQNKWMDGISAFYLYYFTRY